MRSRRPSTRLVSRSDRDAPRRLEREERKREQTALQERFLEGATDLEDLKPGSEALRRRWLSPIHVASLCRGTATGMSTRRSEESSKIAAGVSRWVMRKRPNEVSKSLARRWRRKVRAHFPKSRS